MAILQVLGSDKALRINDNPVTTLVSSFDWAPNFNAQDVFEMGSTAKVDTSMELETSGSFELGASGNTAGLLARMKPARDGSGNFTGYTYNSGGATGKNGYTFTQDDLAEMKFDLILHEKPDQKTFSRSLYLPCAYLTTFSGRADANGNATETFNFAGSFVTGFNTPFHDIRSVPATRTSATSATLSDTSVASTTYTLAFLFVDGKPIRNVNTDATYATLGAGGVVTISTTEGYTIPTGALIMACVYKTTPGTTFPTVTTAQRFADAGGNAINYVKGYSANIYLAPVSAGAPVAADQWLKVQNIDWSVDLRVETLRQIALNKQGSSIYARVPTFPIDISANISVTESDWADWKQVLNANKTFTGTQVHDSTYDFAPANLKPTFAVVVDYFTKSGTKIQNWQFLDMRVDGYGNRAAVSGRGEISWTLKGTQFTLTGYNP